MDESSDTRDLTTSVEQVRGGLSREQEISNFFQNASIGLCWVRPDGIILWANQAEIELLGFQKDEYIGHHIAEFHVDPRVSQDILRRLQSREGLHDYESQLRCKDGSIRDVLISSNAFANEDGFVHWCFARDISSQKRYERRLVAQYDVTRILAAASPVEEAAPKLLEALCQGLGWQVGVLWNVDGDDEILRCHAIWQPSQNGDFNTVCRDRALPRGIDLPGRVWANQRPDWIADLRGTVNLPRLAAAAESGLRAAFGFPILRGGIVSGVVELFSEQIRHPDEELLNVGFVIGSEIGEVLERQRVQKSLAEREESYRVLTETASDGIISIDAGSTILFANTASGKIFGYTRQELLGANLTMLMPDYLQHVHRAGIQRYLETGQRHLSWEAVPLPGRHKDGHEIPLEISFAEYEEKNKHVFIGIIRDVTERKQLDEKLRETAKLESLGVLAGGIAHDFNNLLTGILGNISLALEMIYEAHPANTILHNAVESSERAAQLTRQLLAYAGKGRFIIQPINISHLAGDLSRLLKASIPNTVQLRLELDDHLPAMEGDATQIQQLIMNLVINGAEAIPEGKEGTVLIKTSVQDIDARYIARTFPRGEIAPGKYVAVEVNDTGCGMDEAILSRIFDPFFSTKFTGRGLGLAAALGIVRGHHGALKVYSTPGRGSTFKVLFPAADVDVPEPQPRTPERELTGHGTVLVVDDEEVVRKSAKSMLERYGYSVLTAENGMDAVEIFRQKGNQIDLVILDLTMPVMNGEAALRRLKLLDPKVPVLLSSGYNEIEAVERFVNKGLAGFVQKPYTSARLAEKV